MPCRYKSFDLILCLSHMHSHKCRRVSVINNNSNEMTEAYANGSSFAHKQNESGASRWCVLCLICCHHLNFTPIYGRSVTDFQTEKNFTHKNRTNIFTARASVFNMFAIFSTWNRFLFNMFKIFSSIVGHLEIAWCANSLDMPMCQMSQWLLLKSFTLFELSSIRFP